MVHPDRREFVRALMGGAAGLTLAWPAFGQGRGGAPAPLVATKLSDRIAVVSGAGGNIGVVVGRDGVMMIDGGTANRADDVAKTIADVNPGAVQVLFNTHYHFDHVGSNELLGAKRVRIIAHEAVKTRLGTTFDNPAMGRKMDALSVAGQPTETFTTGGRMTFGQDAIEYTHVPPAHTDGDSFLFISSANVIHTGDLFWVGRYPVVDYTVGGSLAAMAAALAVVDQAGDANTRIIPGHGGQAGVTKADLRQTREIWLEINKRLEDHARQGHSIEQVIGAAPTKDFDARVGSAMPDGFLRQAYGGILARR